MKALLALTIFFALSLTASADAIYSYTGNPFTGNTGTLCSPQLPSLPICVSPTGNIVGTLTLAQPLTPGSPLTTVNPLSFLFSGGGLSLGNNSPQLGTILFQFGTDAQGHIIDWNVFLRQSGGSLKNFNILGTSPAQDMAGNEPDINLFNTNSPGVWTMTETPEPSSVFLLGTGLWGIILSRRRSKGAR